MIDNDLLSDLIEYNQYRYYCFKKNINYDKNLDFERKLNSHYQKVSRTKKRFIYLLCRFKYIYFITFTFNDILLDKCDRVKKDCIKDCLNSFSDDIHFILNRDYGAKNDREHFHCLVATNSDKNILKHIENNYFVYEVSSRQWVKGGIVWVKRVVINEKSLKCLSKYINKLSNHATKSTTKSSRIYYNFKAYDDLELKSDKFKMYTKDKIKLNLI